MQNIRTFAQRSPMFLISEKEVGDGNAMFMFAFLLAF